MSRHVAISPERRIALPSGSSWSLCALRRSSRCERPDGFGTPILWCMNQGSQALTGSELARGALPVFADLNRYDVTTHFVGQSTILTLNGNRATGEAYCLAHHVTMDAGRRRLMIASLRYLDTFAKIDGAWLFAERLLYVDWLEERTLS